MDFFSKFPHIYCRNVFLRFFLLSKCYPFCNMLTIFLSSRFFYYDIRCNHRKNNSFGFLRFFLLSARVENDHIGFFITINHTTTEKIKIFYLADNIKKPQNSKTRQILLKKKPLEKFPTRFLSFQKNIPRCCSKFFFFTFFLKLFSKTQFWTF